MEKIVVGKKMSPPGRGILSFSGFHILGGKQNRTFIYNYEIRTMQNKKKY